MQLRKLLIAFLTLLAVAVPASAGLLHRGATGGGTFPNCVSSHPTGTKLANNSTFSRNGYTWTVQAPVNVSVAGVVYTSPICGGIWQDNTDPNHFWIDNYAQEYWQFDQARQTRAEFVPINTFTNAPPSFGINTAYRDVFDIYISSQSNIVGTEFQNLSQTHAADTRYGLDIPPNPNPTNSGQAVLAVPPFTLGFTQSVAGGSFTVRPQTTWGRGMQATNVFNGTTTGTTQGTAATFTLDTWHTIDQTEIDGHGYTGAFVFKLDGVTLQNYSGNTGMEFVDILRYHGQPSSQFNASMAGNTLNVNSITAGAIAVGQYVHGKLGEVSGDPKITSGSGLTWTYDGPPQTIASTNMVGSVEQGSYSYQKEGQYWGMFACGAGPYCNYPPVGTRVLGERKNEYIIFLNYNAIANTGSATGSATSGVAYSHSLVLTRGTSSTGTPVFGISGSVPGLSLDTATGIYSGTPTTPGTYSITFSVTDTQGTTTGAPVTFTVSSNASCADGQLDFQCSQALGLAG